MEMTMENNKDAQVDEMLEKCIFQSRVRVFSFCRSWLWKDTFISSSFKKIRDRIGKDLLMQGKNVAVITFTNAATDEIFNRLDYTSVFIYQPFIVLYGIL